MKKLIFSLFLCQGLSLQAQYFPPLNNNSAWAEANFSEFPYDSTFTDSLFRFLDEKNSKAFLVLYDGKIVIEKYFDQFTKDSAWYWASAGKSLSAFLVGQAQEKGILDLGKPTSHYLGRHWSDLDSTREDSILVWHQLAMCSGLNDKVPDPDCTDPACLQYEAPAGSKWAYHNAPYHLIHDVVEAASGQSWQQFTTQNISLRTGISGLWINHVFYSVPRSAARFGLLMLRRGIWNSDTLLHSASYFDSMIHSSQTMNPSYGLLWWLNGQSGFMIPQVDIRFPGSLNPDAPADMYAALGKNDQKIYVVPSEKLVVVRMGEPSGGTVLGPSSLDAELWQHIHRWRSLPNGLRAGTNPSLPLVFPVPADQFLEIPANHSLQSVFSADGQIVPVTLSGSRLLTSTLQPGIYFIRLMDENQIPKTIRVPVAH